MILHNFLTFMLQFVDVYGNIYYRKKLLALCGQEVGTLIILFYSPFVAPQVEHLYPYVSVVYPTTTGFEE